MSLELDSTISPWHAGEVELQRRLGVAEQMDAIGHRVFRDHLIEQHREFYSLLPFIVIGAVDPQGLPWATIRAGRPGFLHSPEPLTLAVEAGRDWGDPAEQGMEEGDALGLLGIDLTTRRRNRLNGTLTRSDESRFMVKVGQSFGNCPRYIQNRHVQFARDPATPSSKVAVVSDTLGDDARRLIETADTFFVASFADRSDAGRQVDVSHRGGRPGFVRVDPDGSLTVPDFNGNLFFNTLGNFVVNPCAGLLFVDFERGDVLQLSGSVEIIDDPAQVAAFRGAERLWRMVPASIVMRPDALPLRWTFAQNGFSPNSLMTGEWRQVTRRP
jgi:predicted pyridoxine 5'-phosphate oxidase superfamily flavin-nucleotide-binding protein